MGVYENCKAKIKKNNNTKQKQEEPVDQIKPTSEVITNSSLTVNEASKNGGPGQIAPQIQIFSFYELKVNWNGNLWDNQRLLGQGGFSQACRGLLKSTNQVVAIKRLCCNKWQGGSQFLVEQESVFGLLHHPHFVNLIGYCADEDQRLLVYEYMSRGSLEDHLRDTSPSKKRLDWRTRMKIAADVAKALEYLHDKVNPPIIYTKLECSNILLDEGYHPKLSDFSLAEVDPVVDVEIERAPWAWTTNKHIAPEYRLTGRLTLKSDVYSFGLVLLEIITGRKAVDYTKSIRERFLVDWASSRWSKFSEMVDPMLQGQYPLGGLRRALTVAARCVALKADERPGIADVATLMNKVASEN